MATRSRIGIENENGRVESIYCHWDGYPDNNGKMLARHYTDVKKIKSLIALGDISILNENVVPADGVSHSFESPADNVTVAYHRDRGEEFRKPRENNSIEEFSRSDVEEYGYVFTRDEEWKVVLGQGKIKNLADVLE
jgi:hypothetical protein